MIYFYIYWDQNWLTRIKTGRLKLIDYVNVCMIHYHMNHMPLEIHDLVLCVLKGIFADFGYFAYIFFVNNTVFGNENENDK